MFNTYKKIFKIWFFKIENFSFLFLTSYLILSLFMIILFDIPLFSFLFLKFYVMLLLGLYSGFKLSDYFFDKIFHKINFKNNLIYYKNNKFINLIIFFPFISITISWFFILYRYTLILHPGENFYASLRNQMLINPRLLLPVSLSYMNGLIFFVFMFNILNFIYKKSKFNFYLILISAVFIFLNDLMSSGRVGLLFLIFILIGVIYIKKISIVNFKMLFFGIIALTSFMMPRLIRGGFDLMSANSGYSAALRDKFHWIPPSILDIYVYYFAPPYALSELLKTNFFANHTYGLRIFAPLNNLFLHFFSSLKHIDLVDIFVNPSVLVYGNIYTVIRDYYMDFGLFGVFFIPFLIGFVFKFFYRINNIYADILKLIFFIWLFSIPLYHVFMLGSILVCSILAVVLLFIHYKTDFSQG
jgi:oligosaccharide repeat unit polymerase